MQRGAPAAASAFERKSTGGDVKDWGVTVFDVNGHGLVPDFENVLAGLKQEGTTERAHITLRTNVHGKVEDFVAESVDTNGNGLLEPDTSPAKEALRGRRMLSTESMSTFLRDTAERYPAKRQLVCFTGHSGQLRGPMTKIHQALREMVAQTGKKIDVLVFDSCFLAQIETASEFKDVANYLVASQEGVVKFRPWEKIVRELDGKVLTGEELAAKIATKNEEFTFSAVDLGHVGEVNEKIRALGERILEIDDPKALAAMRRAISDAPDYYAEGFFEGNEYHNTVDLYAFVEALRNRPELQGYRELRRAAAEVLRALGSPKTPNDAIVAERHSNVVDRWWGDYSDVRGSHGLSIHLSTTPKALSDQYTYFGRDSVFNQETGWDAVAAHITSTRTPGYLAASAAKYFGGMLKSWLVFGAQTLRGLFA